MSPLMWPSQSKINQTSVYSIPQPILRYGILVFPLVLVSTFLCKGGELDLFKLNQISNFSFSPYIFEPRELGSNKINLI